MSYTIYPLEESSDGEHWSLDPTGSETSERDAERIRQNVLDAHAKRGATHMEVRIVEYHRGRVIE